MWEMGIIRDALLINREVNCVCLRSCRSQGERIYVQETCLHVMPGLTPDRVRGRLRYPWRHDWIPVFAGMTLRWPCMAPINLELPEPSALTLLPECRRAPEGRSAFTPLPTDTVMPAGVIARLEVGQGRAPDGAWPCPTRTSLRSEPK